MRDGVRVQLRMAVADAVGVVLVRDVVLPAVPRADELVLIGPCWDPIPVEQVLWRIDDVEDDIDEPTVVVVLDDVDLRVAADGISDGIDAFRGAGWRTTTEELGRAV